MGLGQLETTQLKVFTVEERPAFAVRLGSLDDSWPAFMKNGKVVKRYWGSVNSVFPEFQIMLYDEPGDSIVAEGHAIPIAWDGRRQTLPAGIDAILRNSLIERVAEPDTLCALAVVVALEHRQRGLSRIVLEVMRALGIRHGLRKFVAPVRPSKKSLYPLTPIERYVQWTDRQGLPFDPWLRVHSRLGASILQIAPQSIVVTGSVADWEVWSGLAMPDSGTYVVPGALEPVTVDRGKDVGRYEEPNVWVRHT